MDETQIDQFIRDYCQDAGIRCDGDVFGVMFSGVEYPISAEDAADLIESGADIYQLRG